MNKKLIVHQAIGTLLLLLSINTQAAFLSFNLSSQTTPLGQQSSVDLIISELGNGSAPSLGAFDLDVSFDDSLLAFNSATFGDQLDLFNLGLNPAAITPGVGVINLFEISLDTAFDLNNLQADSFTLATLTFDTLNIGTSDLNLSNVLLGDADGTPLLADIQSGSISIVEAAAVPVPEPATLLLLGIGMVGLFGFGSKHSVSFLNAVRRTPEP